MVGEAALWTRYRIHHVCLLGKGPELRSPPKVLQHLNHWKTSISPPPSPPEDYHLPSKVYYNGGWTHLVRPVVESIHFHIQAGEQLNFSLRLRLCCRRLLRKHSSHARRSLAQYKVDQCQRATCREGTRAAMFSHTPETGLRKSSYMKQRNEHEFVSCRNRLSSMVSSWLRGCCMHLVDLRIFPQHLATFEYPLISLVPV